MASWRTKAAISLKRIKMEESYYAGPIGTHQRSFERYHPRPHTASPSSGLGVCNLATPSQEQVPTPIMAGTFTGPKQIKPITILEKMEREHI